MLSGLLRRRPSGKHPTLEQVFAALVNGCCMYSPISNCSSRPRSVGPRSDDDSKCVLVCKAHYGRLRKLEPRVAAELDRYLTRAFAESRAGRLHLVHG
jgi:hypothetical protein